MASKGSNNKFWIMCFILTAITSFKLFLTSHFIITNYLMLSRRGHLPAQNSHLPNKIKISKRVSKHHLCLKWMFDIRKSKIAFLIPRNACNILQTYTKFKFKQINSIFDKENTPQKKMKFQWWRLEALEAQTRVRLLTDPFPPHLDVVLLLKCYLHIRIHH